MRSLKMLCLQSARRRRVVVGPQRLRSALRDVGPSWPPVQRAVNVKRVIVNLLLVSLNVKVGYVVLMDVMVNVGSVQAPAQPRDSVWRSLPAVATRPVMRARIA